MYAIFIGSGNTLGLNLQLFNGQYDTKEKMERLGAPQLAVEYSAEDYNFMKRHRWASSVSTKLNCFEINLGKCSGGVAEHLHILQQLRKNNLEVLRTRSNELIIDTLQQKSFDFSKVEYIFLEFFVVYGPEDRVFHSKQLTPFELEEFLKTDDIEIEELRHKILQWRNEYDSVAYVDLVMKNFIKEIEYLTSQNKKVCIIWWKSTTNKFNESERFSEISKYVVRFPTEENKNNLYAEEFLIANNHTIYQEHPLGEYLPRKNLYGSIVGHKMIADTILEFVNKT